MNEIKCPECGRLISIDKALEDQIESRIMAEANAKHKADIDAVKKQAEEDASRSLELEKLKAAQDLEFEKKKMLMEMDAAAKAKALEQEMLAEQLKVEAAAEKASNAELRKQFAELLERFRHSEEARENMQVETQKKLNEEAAKIREDARKQAEDASQLRIAEMEKQLHDTQDLLVDAQRKATQGSQQNQGEVLELSLEDSLKGEFIFDVIEEVKKGQRGADVVQTIKDRGEECGVLLWETKNAAWQAAWIAKFKNDIREAGASAGILVSKDIPEKYDDIAEIEGVWVVRPRFALPVGAIIRSQIIGIHNANRNAQNKDSKMEILYQYLTGTEFKHRVEAILDNYKSLQDELEKERRAAEKRWAKQERSIRAVITNTARMYGDLQGLIGGALEDIMLLEGGDAEEDDT